MTSLNHTKLIGLSLTVFSSKFLFDYIQRVAIIAMGPVMCETPIAKEKMVKPTLTIGSLKTNKKKKKPCPELHTVKSLSKKNLFLS